MIPILSIAVCLIALSGCVLAWWLRAVTATVRDLRVRVEYLLREGGVGDEEERDGK
jgi:hypothetical protein